MRGIYHFRWFWDYSGGQMTNLGAHELDIVHWVLKAQGSEGRFFHRRPLVLKDGCETPDTQDAIWEYPGFTAELLHPRGRRGSAAALGGGLAVLRRQRAR